MRGRLRPMLDARALKVLKLITALPCDARVRPGCFEMWPVRVLSPGAAQCRLAGEA